MIWRGPSDLSYRFKVPLNVSLVILVTASVVACVLIWRSWGDLRDELYGRSVELGQALGSTLVTALKHDDLWRAYEVLKAAAPVDHAQERVLILLDEGNRIYASSRPRKYPVQGRPGELGPELARLERDLIRGAALEPYLYEQPGYEHLYVVLPVVDDGLVLGNLVMRYPKHIFVPQLLDLASGVALSTLAVMAVLLPIGWYIGDRTVQPLTQLASGMAQVGRGRADEIEQLPDAGGDEIGELTRQFRHMLDELAQKQALEHQMVVSDRLAAVGRVAAGVAHEINNPLGGMFNALNTFRRHGPSDPVTERTVSLLERGLAQIRDTVSALLVEARAESHPLAEHDLEDVRTLVQSELQRRNITLDWHNALPRAVPLPSTPLRQVLINLCLNAVQAAGHGGRVSCTVVVREHLLVLQVENDGEAIPAEDLERLFEPFVGQREGGSGLGLWVTYQIVRQLRGDVQVASEPGWTRFTVRVPLLEMAA